MFENVPTGELLRRIRTFDFDADPVHEAGGNRIDAIVALDRVVREAQAEQAAQIASLHAERTRSMGIGRGDPSLSVIGEVSMARNISPSSAGTQLGLALGLARLPQVMGLFASGQVPETVARAVVNESTGLHVDDFVVLDAEIAPLLPGLTHVKAARVTARAVIRIDADAALERATTNRADQRVSMFGDTDGVAILQVRGPAEQILAAFNTLDGEASRARAAGDSRTRGQVMCQTLVERVTGLTHADTADVEIGLVMDARTFAADGDEPVNLTGHGPISPNVADDIIARAHRVTVRRLLVDPIDGTLLVREPRRRFFDAPTAAHIRTRDQHCRQPGCDSLIRDNDHIHDHANGGPTTADNGQGLCKRSHTINPPSTSCREVPPSNPAGRSSPKAKPPSGRPPPATSTDPTHHPCSQETAHPAHSANRVN